jgi:hypothetical protein
MAGVCRKHGENKKCLHSFYQEAPWEETHFGDPGVNEIMILKLIF